MAPPTPRRVPLVLRVVAFAALLLAGALGLVVLPRKTIAAEENRRLATWPPFDRVSVMTGRFSKGVESYVADHFPFRRELLRLSDQITQWQGVGTPEIQIVTGTASMVPGSEGTLDASPTPERPTEQGAVTSEAPAKMEDSPSAGAKETPEEEVFSVSNSVVIYRGRAIQRFLLPPTQSERYARVMARWSEALGPTVRLYLMPIPVGSDFYLPEKIKGAVDHERAGIEQLFAALPAGVVPVHAYEELAAHREEAIFFRTDHHWTGRGAYYGYVAFAKAAGFEPLAMGNLTRRACGRFLGSLHAQTRSAVLAAAPDSVEMFLVGNRVQVRQLLYDQRTWQRGALYLACRGYQSFLGLDYPAMDITTDVGNGRRILVVKDSYGNAFVPFLAAHYERIWVIDYRYYGASVQRLIEQEEIDEVLFVHNMQVINTPYAIRREVALLAGAPPLALPTRPAPDSTKRDSINSNTTPK